jgi:hypothetical protein
VSSPAWIRAAEVDVLDLVAAAPAALDRGADRLRSEVVGTDPDSAPPYADRLCAPARDDRARLDYETKLSSTGRS